MTAQLVCSLPLTALQQPEDFDAPDAPTCAGHARVYCCFDVLFRLLRHLGYDVQYVRNFTDIDDKIIARAAEMGEDPLQLSHR